MSSKPLLRLKNIHKSFGPVRALKGVDLDVRAGEVLGLIGENGAGKSTLMKILSAVYQPDAGTMELDGSPFSPASPLEARAAGISMIYQELNLAPQLSVEANIVLGMERHQAGWISSSSDIVRDALTRLGHAGLDPASTVSRLGLAERQVVEIARALVADARVVIMDEPTSSLTARDTRTLFEVVRRLRDEGVGVVYISHFLEEVKEVCDRFSVLRDGETVASGDVASTTIDQFVEFMIGRPAGELYPGPGSEPGPIVLTLTDLRGRDSRPDGVDLTLRRSEILGIFGLVGAGRSETIRTAFGLHPAADGSIEIANDPNLKASWISPPRALDRGLDLLSEDRKSEGLAGRLPVLDNLTLSALGRYSKLAFLRRSAEEAEGRRWLDRFKVTLHSPDQRADTLSGGNQQKLCLARLLHHDSEILFLDEPTRGVDVGSKAEIYRIIREIAANGKSIIMVSSYLPELLGMCHTLAIMHRGRISPVRPVSDWTEVEIMRHATAGAEQREGSRDDRQ
jgi:ribose transport system ATP-binding protein